MTTIKIFLASSEELREDRRAFEIFIRRRNDILVNRNIRLKLIIWEDFLDAMAETRLQDKYNEALKDCDIFIMLFHTKVGNYTEEEFDAALQQFQSSGRPKIYTYLKDVPAEKEPDDSFKKFKARLEGMEHFYIKYPNTDRLENHFRSQLERLDQEGFFNTVDSNPVQSDISVLDTVKKKISNGDSIAKIIDKYRLELLALSPDRETELTLLQSRSNKLDKDIRIGIISSSDANINQNRINHAFISLLDEIKDDQERG